MRIMEKKMKSMGTMEKKKETTRRFPLGISSEMNPKTSKGFGTPVEIIISAKYQDFR